MSQSQATHLGWSGPLESLTQDQAAIQNLLCQTQSPLYVVGHQGLSFGSQGHPTAPGQGQAPLLAQVPAVTEASLGDGEFLRCYQVDYPYFAGSMANGISSAEMVIALGKKGLLASFGAGGLVPAQVEKAILTIQAALPQGPYAFNLIYAPNEEALERGAVELFLKHGVKVVEASAYINLTQHIVRYRLAGLKRAANGQVEIQHRILAKVSRREVATRFMSPAPAQMVDQLLAQGLVTSEQAELAKLVPMADDVTAEADSGGHTDNRPFISLLPSILSLKDEIQAQYQYAQPIRVGAGGGIGTPDAVLAAFMMGAAYVVTGSVNHGCVEAGTSEHAKNLLAQADMADVAMAPASDMFEQGVKLQVLKRGTLFPMRANKLWEIYSNYESLEAIPTPEREKLEKQIFKKSLQEIWQETQGFFQERDPEQLEKAAKNPKKKMALVFRWYLGLSSHWARRAEPGREMDFQIWTGPAMGAFNHWVKGSFLEAVPARTVDQVALNLLQGACYLYRLQALRMQGVVLPASFQHFSPRPL